MCPNALSVLVTVSALTLWAVPPAHAQSSEEPSRPPGADARAEEERAEEESHVDRYPADSLAQRPLTVPQRLVLFQLALGADVPALYGPSQREVLLNGAAFIGYGITDQLEWGVPFSLRYRVGDLTARDGWEAAFYGGVLALGIAGSDSGTVVFVTPGAGVGVRRLRLDLHPVLSVEPSVGIIREDVFQGARFSEWSVALGGFRRPPFYFHVDSQVDALGVVGLVFNRRQLTFQVGAGLNVRL